jgi:predicted Rossmann fold flavoprotein
MNDTRTFDCLVIGGGPAGMMAAYSCRINHPEATVAILDRTFELGRKILTTGAGRGNITNVNVKNNPENHYHGDTEFIKSVFSRFGYEEIMKFFDTLGVPVYEEKKTGKGKIFPVIDNAKTIRSIFVNIFTELKIPVFCNTTVISVAKKEKAWNIVTSEGEFTAKQIILAAGGKTYPALGSDGSGYAIAASLGHTIIPPVVSAVPLVSKNMLSHFLQGEKMVMKATAVQNGSAVAEATGDVMFTQYGFSGPAIFDISREFSIAINRENICDMKVRLSFFPDSTRDEVISLIKKRITAHPLFPVATVLWGLLTEKAAGGVCAVCKFPKEKKASEMTGDDIFTLVNVLTAFEADVTGTRGWNEAEFTAGGVATADVDATTMKSHKDPALSFAGEILDVDGDVGGYNLSWAWATGWIAGKSGC